MLCAIYKSKRKSGMYLYIEKRDNFDPVPKLLMQSFGNPEFVMLFNLLGNKPLAKADNQVVLQQIQEKGFYLQMPQDEDGLFFTASKKY